ncbi:carboxypeptidase regulatory-like domain-containing protein [Natrialbaceae archaeon A-CW3]
MRSSTRFVGDERAIEGLPIRLIIALVVGVASLAIMMSMLGGIGTLAETEVDVEVDPVTIDAGTTTDVQLTVVGEDGNTVEDATVIVMSDDAWLDAAVKGETDVDGTVTLSLDPELRQGQRTGSLAIDVVPPTNTDYVNEQDNTEIVVIEN